MPKLSAALLVYRPNRDKTLDLLIVHPGGPFWAKKDDAAWSIPKGEYLEGDDPFECALREFAEELGTKPPEGDFIDLGEIRQPSGKRIRCWAVEGDLDVTDVISNEFEMEWPKGSGRVQSFPEVDRAGWFPTNLARIKLLKGHTGFIDRLTEELGSRGVTVLEADDEPPAEQATLF